MARTSRQPIRACARLGDKGALGLRCVGLRTPWVSIGLNSLPAVPPPGGIVRRGSPFHSRTSALCESWEWRGWCGYLAASSWSLVPEMEYYAIRHSAGLVDVSPLYRSLISGKDALHLVNKVVTRDASKLAKGQIYYT